MPEVTILKNREFRTVCDHFDAGVLALGIKPANVNYGMDPSLVASIAILSVGGAFGVTAVATNLAAASIAAAVAAKVALATEASLLTSALSVPIIGPGVAFLAAGSIESAATAAGSAAGAGASVGAVNASMAFGAAAAAVAVVGAGVGVGYSMAHERVGHLVILNPSPKTYHCKTYIRQCGNVTCPDEIPPNSAVGIVYHHSGPELQIYLKYESDDDVLCLGFTNPYAGGNKFRCELVPKTEKYTLPKCKENTCAWCQLRGPVHLIKQSYGNPSGMLIMLHASKGEKLAVLSAMNARMSGIKPSVSDEESWKKLASDDSTANNAANKIYVYWRKYGNNWPLLCPVSKATYEENLFWLTTHVDSLDTAYSGFYAYDTKGNSFWIKNNVKVPQIHYSSDTFWYGYLCYDIAEVAKMTDWGETTVRSRMVP